MHFEIYETTPGSSKGTWRWRLVADNNSDIIADSSEEYVRIEDCLNGIELVKRSSDAPIRDGKEHRSKIGGMFGP